MTKGICVSKDPVKVGERMYKRGEVFECDASELQALCVRYPEAFSTYNPESAPEVKQEPSPEKTTASEKTADAGTA